MITADTITSKQIRGLRERYGEGTRLWDPAIVYQCDIALGDLLFDDIGRVQALREARARCAEILNELGVK